MAFDSPSSEYHNMERPYAHTGPALSSDPTYEADPVYNMEI